MTGETGGLAYLALAVSVPAAEVAAGPQGQADAVGVGPFGAAAVVEVAGW